MRGQAVRQLSHTRKVSKIPTAQIALLLLRYCAVPRWHFILRQMPHTHTAVQCNSQQIDSCARECFQTMGGLPTLTDWQTETMQLPIAEGGFGILSCSRIAPVAFYAAAADSAHSLLTRKLVKNVTVGSILAKIVGTRSKCSRPSSAAAFTHRMRTAHTRNA